MPENAALPSSIHLGSVDTSGSLHDVFVHAKIPSSTVILTPRHLPSIQ
jgi:hypothetical protein